MQNNPFRSFISSEQYYFWIAFFILIGFAGLFIPIMEVDAAQYASISREMLERNSFLHITDNYKDYLDKPPLLFWISALSIKMLGVNSFAYKLPTFLIALAGVFALFKLTQLLYDNITARIASLFYLSSVAFILMVNDVRTDTILISFVIMAVWQLTAYIEKGKSKNLLWGFVAIAFAMMSKGPIGFVVPFMATLPHLALKGRWHRLFKWQWLMAPVIILLLLAPMLYGLYTQFDLHPEKEAYGLQGPSGVKFFFWDQSFGRITGDNAWKNEATHFYFLHNIAWAFLPYTFLLLAALVYSVKNFTAKKEYVSFFGFLLPFVALSFSHYKLPHYIYITVPFAAMLAAELLQSAAFQNNFFKKSALIFQHFIGFVLLTGGVLLLFIVFKASLPAMVILALIASGLVYGSLKINDKIISPSIAGISVAALILNIHAYPSLLKYQSTSEVAFYINEEGIPKEKFYQHNTWGRALNYYTKRITPDFRENIMENQQEAYLYIRHEDLDYFEEKYSTIVLRSFPHINVTRLSIGFINPATRNDFTQIRHLIKIEQNT
jgi:4-amino-4-deoxy-L-arabinose transferase-like glycosyltransferase